MASRAEYWRQRLRAGLARVGATQDPKAALLRRIDGEPSADLLAALSLPSRAAAVLVGFVERGDDTRLLLTERGAHLKDHPGQVSFPGGRLSTGDANAIAAALRESEEEVGLAASQVEVLGSLPAELTVTGFEITPVLAWLAADFAPRPDPAEVDAVFEVPLRHLLDPANRQTEIRERLGTRFHSELYRYDGHCIWGATAAIVGIVIDIINEKT